MLYQYRALDQHNRIYRGQQQAANLADLELRLSHAGLTLIRAKSCANSSHHQRKIARRDLVNFCFHLEQLTEAGVPLIESLIDLRDSTESPYFRDILACLVEDIEGGSPLSQALEKYPHIFDSVFVHLIKAGENSGKLPEVLRHLTSTLKWQDETAAHTKKILIYPAFVGALVISVIIFLMIYLVPQLVAFVADMGQTLPWNTRILLAISHFLTHYGWIPLVTALLVAGTIRMRIRHNRVFRIRAHRWQLRIPLIGPILHKIILARFAHFFAMLFSAGIPVLDCLRISGGIAGNAAIAEDLDRLARQVCAGAGITASFQEAQLFPPSLLRMLRVGEMTGALDTALLSVAYFYDRDVKESIERIHALLEPTLTVMLGLVLAWVMTAVLGPIFDTIGQMR